MINDLEIIQIFRYSNVEEYENPFKQTIRLVAEQIDSSKPTFVVVKLFGDLYHEFYTASKIELEADSILAIHDIVNKMFNEKDTLWTIKFWYGTSIEEMSKYWTTKRTNSKMNDTRLILLVNLIIAEFFIGG